MKEPKVICEDIEKLTEEEWLKLRTTGIGGSDAAKILGVSGFSTSRDLYYDKVGENKPDIKKNWIALEVGHRLEELVVQIFMEKNPGWFPYADRRMFRSAEYPFMLADVDFFVRDPNTGKVGIVECKTTNSITLLEKWGISLENKVPVDYELQVRHYMAVMNLDFAIIICLAGNNEQGYRQRLVTRDLSIEKSLIEAEKRFWEENVLKRIPPALDNQKASVLDTVVNHYGLLSAETEDDTVDLSDSVKDFEKYLSLEEERSALEKQAKELKKQEEEIVASLLDMTEGRSGICTIEDIDYELSSSSRTTISIPSAKLQNLKLEYPDIYNKYVEVKTSVSPTIKKIKAKKKAV